MNLNLHHNFKNHDSDETVMLLHGFIADSGSMKEVGDTLGRTFNILYVDLPGFGRSKSSAVNYDMETVAYNLKMILDELKLEKVHVLGYSMGGRVGLSFAILYPEYTRSLILESTSPGLKTETDKNDRIKIDQQRAIEITSDYRTFLDGWENMGLFQNQQNLTDGEFLRQRRMRQAQNPEEVADSLRKYGTGVQPSYWDRLSDLHMPVLLIAGARDQKFVSINEEMQKDMNQAALEIVEDAGHNIHLESQAKFDTIITEFLT